VKINKSKIGKITSIYSEKGDIFLLLDVYNIIIENNLNIYYVTDKKISKEKKKNLKQIKEFYYCQYFDSKYFIILKNFIN